MKEIICKNENRCRVVNRELGRLGQYIIYFFNKLSVRTKVIRDAIKEYKKDDKFCYFGTWYVEGPKLKLMFRDPYDEELKKDFREKMSVYNFIKKHKSDFELKRKILFTVCYCYDENNVHFVSFIYDSKKQKLIHFDPGVHCYPKGQDVLVPSIVSVFKRLKLIKDNRFGKSHDELGDDCPRYKYILKEEPIGIQYNGEDKDAFCQSWTLFFLIDQIKQYDENVEELCRIIPENRELHLYENFIIPFLKKNPTYLKEIIDDLKDEIRFTKKPKEYLTLLDEYINVCKFQTIQQIQNNLKEKRNNNNSQKMSKNKNTHKQKKVQEKYNLKKKIIDKKYKLKKKLLDEKYKSEINSLKKKIQNES